MLLGGCTAAGEFVRGADGPLALLLAGPLQEYHFGLSPPCSGRGTNSGLPKGWSGQDGGGLKSRSGTGETLSRRRARSFPSLSGTVLSLTLDLL